MQQTRIIDQTELAMCRVRAKAITSDRPATSAKEEMIRMTLRRLEKDGELSGKELFDHDVIFSH